MNHVKQAVDACGRMGYFKKYATALDDRNKAHALYLTAGQDIAAAKDAGAGDAILTPLVEARKQHKSDAKAAEEERIEAAEGFFSLYGMPGIRSSATRLGFPTGPTYGDGSIKERVRRPRSLSTSAYSTIS